MGEGDPLHGSMGVRFGVSPLNRFVPVFAGFGNEKARAAPPQGRSLSKA